MICLFVSLIVNLQNCASIKAEEEIFKYTGTSKQSPTYGCEFELNLNLKPQRKKTVKNKLYFSSQWFLTLISSMVS